MTPQPTVAESGFEGRRRLVLGFLLLALCLLVARALYLQVVDTEHLQSEGDARYIKQVDVPAYRGRILDRNGEILAISTPVKSITVNPRVFTANEAQIRALAKLLRCSQRKIRNLIGPDQRRGFAYLKRQVDPGVAAAVEAMQLPGVSFKREFRRYYPAGEVSGHLLGFTDIDDTGQEGLERAFDAHLKGTVGSKRIVRDGSSRIIEDVENIRSPEPGEDLVLTIDQRLQYLAYRELKAAVHKHQARSGSLVMLDAQSGEVLAMVNQPSFNPNSRRNRKGNLYRNRAVTDLFEPGSTMKPFAVACALDAGYFLPESEIDTRPGLLRVGRHLVRDHHNYGVIDVARVLQKSSNVGVTKIALSLPPERFWGCYDRLGFGHSVGIGVPAEASGRFDDYRQWRGGFQQATLSFGYGLSTSALQLARAYLALANGGRIPEVTVIKGRLSTSLRVMSEQTAVSLRAMLEQVVSREGTALKAAVPGYRVAGKTGTVRIAEEGGYSHDRYLALFAGMAPASRPRWVMVVMIAEPSAGEYYGGAVAAPVFSRVMESALRWGGVAPDRQDSMALIKVAEGGQR